jgi:hypothetical protein
MISAGTSRYVVTAGVVHTADIGKQARRSPTALLSFCRALIFNLPTGKLRFAVSVARG